MRKFTLLAVFLMVALVAVPASASVQNVKISGAVDNTYLYRSNFNFHPDGTNEEQSTFITQATLQIDADLTDQVSATIALINERGWEADNSVSSSDVDLYLAYVTLREMLYSPLTLVVGRQVFSFGNSFVFDATGANNVAPTDSALSGIAEDLTKQTAIDAVRAILDYNPLTVTLFASTIHPNTTGLVDDDDNKNLYGVNATYELGDEFNTVVEGYIFAQKDKSTKEAGAGSKSDVLYVKGVRASANVLDGLNVQGEFAYQGGTRAISGADDQERKAFAFQGIVNYQIPEDLLPEELQGYNARTQYVFTKLSGEEDGTSSDEKYTAWDPFYEAQGGGTIYNTLFNYTNAVIHSASLTVNPMEDVTSTLMYTKLWTQVALDNSSTITLVQPDGASYTANTNTGKRGLGQELDFMTTYDYTEDVQIGANLGFFWPGEAFVASQPAKQFLVNLNVAF